MIHMLTFQYYQYSFYISIYIFPALPRRKGWQEDEPVIDNRLPRLKSQLADDGIHLNVAGSTRLLKNLGFDNLKNSSKKNSKQNHSTNKRHTNDKTRNQPESKDKHHPVIRRRVQSNYAQVPLSNNKRQHPKENRDSHCWYFGETGHITDSCRHGYRQRCNKKGHKQKSCTVYI